MARRLGHGETITIEQFDRARDSLVESVADVPLAFATAQPVDLKDFDFLFPDLQTDPDNLLPESATTVANLVRLGKTMIDSPGNDPAGDSDISALMTYFGQFIDHDITLELASADLPTLTNPALTPLPLDQIRNALRNTRSATLDLDSVYDLPAPRDPANNDKMLLGRVSPTGSSVIPRRRPDGKDDFNDLPRGPRTADPATDRAAQIGDPRNDENTIVAQLHLAFLRAHNKLVDLWDSFTEPRRVMRQHYQYLVINDFLMQVADKKIVRDILRDGTQFFKPFEEPFFMPLEFSVAAFRFGHTMVRSDYDFNVNFNTSGPPAIPATLGLLFTFSALSGQLGNFETLPENWIIEWENFVGGNPRSKARLFDTKLANPLFELPTTEGTTEVGLGAMLAVRNLLRGYLLRMPTGQALATAMNLTPLTAGELEEVASEVVPPAGEESQLDVLRSSGFSERTPLWYYILAEAAFHAKGKHLGPLGSTLIAEVLIGLIQKSENSILRNRLWEPTLPHTGKFTFDDLLKFAGVLD